MSLKNLSIKAESISQNASNAENSQAHVAVIASRISEEEKSNNGVSE